MTEDVMDEGLMKVSQVAAFLAISRPVVYRLMASGDLPWVKVRKSRRIPRSAVKGFMHKHLNSLS
jgi:excisionase family DNA binding protein